MQKYLDPRNYFRRASTILNRHLLWRFENLLYPRSEQPLAHKPIFVLGPPRSGSTLAIQVITEALELGYISNRHCQLFGAPALAERLFNSGADRPRSDYRSTHGKTQGSHGPAECGEWWYRFFPRNPSYVTLDQANQKRMIAFRGSVAALIKAFNSPIIFKNLYASSRIQPIAHYLPESLFIVIRRDEIENGHSLLEARYNNSGTYASWLSVEPPGVEKIAKLPVHEQVIEQIRQIHGTIDRDLKSAGIPIAHRFDLHYERFCDNPAQTIDELQIFLNRNGCHAKRRDVALPNSFPRRNEVRIDPSLYEKLTSYARASRK